MEKITLWSAPSAFFFIVLSLFSSQAFFASNPNTTATIPNPLETAVYACTGFAVDNFPYSESFEADTGLWTQNGTDDFDWTRDSNGTPSNNTGPTVASEGFFYMYTEATGQSNGAIAIFESPCFDLSNYENAAFEFDYNMRGNQMGTLNLDISTDSSASWTNLFSLSGNQGTAWITETIDLSAYDGQNIRLRFHGTKGGGFQSDMAIDNVNLTADPLPAPEINIVGNGTSITDGDTSPSVGDDTDFGSTVVGLSNINTFTIENTGNVDLVLSGSSPFVSISGPDASLFTVTTIPNGTITAGGTTTFAITYTPTATSTHTASVSISSNDSNESPYTFSIIGTGVGAQPEIGLSSLGNNVLDGDVTPSIYDGTDFGNLLVGSNVSRDYIISNTGTQDLLLTGGSPYVSITGPDALYFNLSIIPTTPIPSSGGSTTFRITYNPLIPGTHNASVSIANNDGDENPFNFDIRGLAATSLVPEIDISGLGVSISDGDTSPNTADDTNFGTIELGNSNVNDFTVSNLGTGLLTFSAASPYATITGADASHFILETFPTGNTIVAGESAVFQIRYKPTSIATHNAVFTLTSDDASEATYNFNIRGTTIAPLEPQETVYYANFDASDENWVVTNPGGRTTWTYGQNAAEPGVEGNHWYTDNYNDYQKFSNTYVTSPVINTSGYNDLKLQLDVRYNLNNDADDAMNIEYSSNGGSSWTILGTTAEASENQWYNETDADGLGNNVDGWAGLNDSGTAALKSKFSRSFINLPSALYNNSQVRIRVRFASDNDNNIDDGANFDNIIITGNTIALPADPSAGPADVTSNLKLWLKADTGIGETDGVAVSTWQDQAKNNDATTSDKNTPTYYNNLTENINYNPVLAFDETLETQLKGKGGYFSRDYWIVMKQEGTIDGTTSGAYEGIIAGRGGDNQYSEDGSGFWTGKISIRFSGNDNMLSHMVGTTPASANSSTIDAYGRAYSDPTDSYTDEVIIINVKANNSGDSVEIYKNGIRVDNIDAYAFNQNTGSIGNVLPYDDLVNSPYALGVSRAGLNRTDISTWFNGKITEFISYSVANSSFDQNRIQSYLAIKNGVTLHSINSTTITRQGDQDYVDSDGTVIWNNALHTGFNYDIAGIGRDDAATLDQKQSISSNSDTILTIGLSDIYDTNSENVASNPDNFTDKNFLMWGNDNAPLSAAAPISVDMSNGIAGLSTLVDFTSIQKTWKIVETGSVGSVRVSIPEISLSATLTPPGDYLMFVSDTPSFSPTSEYRIMSLDGTNLEASYDFDGTKYITFGYAPEYIYERSISFDGAQDYLDVGDELDQNGAFTISAWVKRIGNDYSVISKRNAAYSEGYDISILPSNLIEMSWITGGITQDIQSSVQIPENEWHQFAFTFDGTTASLYLDGYLDSTENLSSPVATSQSFIIGAADGENTTDFFEGTIDEVRVWNIALSQDQVRFIMNQEIEEHTDFNVAGKIVPQNISKNEFASTTWSQLAGYFPMNKYTFTNVKDESDNNLVAAIKNLETVDYQTAPLPYVSAVDGDWSTLSTWTNGTAGMELPHAPSIVNPAETIDWNIVQTSHNIEANTNNSLLFLDISANELTIENDSKMEVSHYLKLDGVMDLVGESQLVQTENSDLDPTSSGNLERDQQGTSDTYSYNGWSSPVGAINTTSNNANFTVSNLMNDGTDENNPVSMTFSGGYNGAPTSPITISAYWLWKYANSAADDYYAWQYVGPSGTMKVGEGYTMKGPGTGAITAPQNYTFKGKPNNSTDDIAIALPITAGNEYFVGNPFPSALDANDFINDNPHLDGTLLFWEHWGGGTHIQAGYQAGYATYTLGGGVPAASHPTVDPTGSGTKTPGRYIPVGQGFFVKANATDSIRIDNTQRNFVKETSGSSFFFFTGNETENNNDDANGYNDYTVEQPDDTANDAPDTRAKFRIGFDSPNLYHRQILLTIDENTTLGYDRSYDGLYSDGPSEDMNWTIDGQKAVIQAIPKLTESIELPLYLKTANAGTIVISLDDLENVDTDITTIYLKDSVQNTYTNLVDNVYTINLEAGQHTNRYYIVIKTGENANTTQNDDQNTDDTSGTDDQHSDNSHTTTNDTDDTQNEIIEVVIPDTAIELEDLNAMYSVQQNAIMIQKNQDMNIAEASLYSMLGQIVKQWTPETNTSELQLPVGSISSGTYILYLQTDMGQITKKLIIH